MDSESGKPGSTTENVYCERHNSRNWRQVARAAGQRLARAEYVRDGGAYLRSVGEIDRANAWDAVSRNWYRVAAELRVEAIGLRVAERWGGTELDREAAQGWAWLRSLEAVRS